MEGRRDGEMESWREERRKDGETEKRSDRKFTLLNWFKYVLVFYVFHRFKVMALNQSKETF